MRALLYKCLFILPLGLWAQGTPEAPVIAEAGPHSRLAGSAPVTGDHISEALGFRSLDRQIRGRSRNR
jgi:hypothetical protein